MVRLLAARFHPGLLSAVVGTLVVTAGLASLTDGPEVAPRPPSLNGRLGIPDCPAGAIHDPLGPRSLECWFYTGATGWRITKRVSAHHAFIVRVEVTDLGAAPDIAHAIVKATRPAFGEVMVYATALPRPSHAGTDDATPGLVTRIRWTEQDGFDTLTFRRPAAR
jgi:hypothetical protein